MIDTEDIKKDGEPEPVAAASEAEVDGRKKPRPPFSPTKSPVSGFEVKFSDEEWAMAHSKDPNALRAARGQRVIEPIKEIMTVDGPLYAHTEIKPHCKRCGCRVAQILPAGPSCALCGFVAV